jgi:hypothetical protein
MDKATLSKKSVLALERLAKKVGAKTVTPEGKRKNKTQLINSVIIAERLGKKNPALKAKKAPAKKTATKSVKPLAEKPKMVYRYVTAESWRKTPADFKTVINGVKYKMVNDGDRGTILAPVKIKKL